MLAVTGYAGTIGCTAVIHREQLATQAKLGLQAEDRASVQKAIEVDNAKNIRVVSILRHLSKTLGRMLRLLLHRVTGIVLDISICTNMYIYVALLT